MMFMIYFPKPNRVRCVFDTEIERQMWQDFLFQCAAQRPWTIKKHVYDNISVKRASTKEIELLKTMTDWHVYALELDLLTRLVDPKPKFVVRYPTLEEDKWLVGGVVAVGAELAIVTLFFNDNLAVV